MKPKASKGRLVAILSIGILAAMGCSDVGDNSASPSGNDAGGVSSLDSTVPGEDAPSGEEASSSSGSGGSSGSGSDDSSGGSTEDASPVSGGSSSGETQDSGGEGADAHDATVEDTSVVDTGIDSTIADSGADAHDASGLEAGIEGGLDAGPDSSGPDGGGNVNEAGPADTGAPDAPAETGGGALAPCTTAGQANCVKCGGNSKTTGPLANGLCTATQAAFVQHDIDKGVATTPGNDPSGSCYDCLFQSTCLDDTKFGDTARDCGDSTIATGTAAQCLAVISCVLGSSCSASTTVACYCGTAPENTTCQGNPASAINGACDGPIAAGLGFSTQDGTDVTAHFTDGDKASGVADQIFNCAVNSQCTMCLQ